MRQIVLDTETTGLDWRKGHRILEIGCVELLDRKPTQRHYHVYLNPEFQVDAAAQAVHGLSNEFLADKPKFAEVARDFIRFIEGAEILIHNAEFDRGFIDNEFALMGLPALTTITAGIVDTLQLARDLRPGRRNSLDVLCKEFDVDNSGRQLHGALLDAELLAEVYLAMTRGQETLLMDLESVVETTHGHEIVLDMVPGIVLRANDEELAAHEQVLNELDKEHKNPSLWRQTKTDDAA